MTRRHLLAAHKWIGISLGVFWLLQALSGLALSYNSVLDTAAYPSQAAPPVTPEDFTRAASAAQAAYPDHTLTRLMLPQRNSRLIDAYVTTQLGETNRVRVLRASGRVMVAESWTKVDWDMPALRLVYLFHFGLLAGSTGHSIIGISGLFLMVTAGIGIAIAWPSGRRWKPVLKPIAWKRTLAAYYSWHRAVGVWFFPGLFAIASTGSMLVWMPQLRQATGLTASEPVTSAKASAIFSAQDIGKAAAVAMNAVPSGAIYMIDAPSPSHRWFRIRLREPGDPREWYGTSTVFVSVGAETPINVSHVSEQSAGYRLLDAVYAVHTGEIIGQAGRLIVFASGLAAAALCVLGYALWIRKKLPKNRRLGVGHAGTQRHSPGGETKR